MNLKLIFCKNIKLFKLYNFTYIKYKSDGGIMLKNLIQNIVPYISYTFWVWLQLYLQFLTEWYIISWQFQQQSCSARWDRSGDIHIGGSQWGVFNFTFSNSGEGGIKNWLQIRIQGPKLPPGRSKKVTNSTMNN